MARQDPSDAELKALLAGTLDEEARLALEQRLETEADFRERLEALAGAAYFQAEFTPESGRNPAPAGVQDLIDQLRQAPSPPPLANDQSSAGYQHLLAPSDLPGSLGRIAGYEIDEIVAAGGMGVIFRATGTASSEPVAIKMLSPALAGDPASRDRFLREASAAARIDHPNVIPIQKVETESEFPYLVMKFVEGHSLQGRLEGLGDTMAPLPRDELIPIAHAVAAGLSAAHDLGLVHRDVKPSNILIEAPGAGDEKPRVFLTDFGLARASEDPAITRSGTFIGTPQFMSPEQASGRQLDGRSDLFSLGTVLYAAATGRLPFKGDSFPALAESVAEDAPDPPGTLNPDLDPWMSNLITRLLAKDPADRPASAADVVEVIEREADLGVLSRGRRLGKRTRLKRRLFRAVTITLAILAVTLSGLAATERLGWTSLVNSLLCTRSGDALYLHGRWGTFESLQLAVDAARSGDVIILRSDSEIASQPVTIPEDKVLTIRAAAGFHPGLSFPSGIGRPAIRTRSALSLQHLSIRQHQAGASPDPLVQLERAPGSIINCRIERAPHARHTHPAPVDEAMIHLVDCPSFVLRRSELYGLLSTGIGALVETPGFITKLDLQENRFRGIENIVRGIDGAAVSATVQGNLVHSGNLFYIQSDDGKVRLDAHASNNFFALRRCLIHFPAGSKRAISERLSWQGESNVFIIDGPFLTIDATSSIGDLEAWKEFLGDPAGERDSVFSKLERTRLREIVGSPEQRQQVLEFAFPSGGAGKLSAQLPDAGPDPGTVGPRAPR